MIQSDLYYCYTWMEDNPTQAINHIPGYTPLTRIFDFRIKGMKGRGNLTEILLRSKTSIDTRWINSRRIILTKLKNP